MLDYLHNFNSKVYQNQLTHEKDTIISNKITSILFSSLEYIMCEIRIFVYLYMFKNTLFSYFCQKFV